MIMPVRPTEPIIDETRAMVPSFQAFILQASNESLATGIGSPEGQLEAGIGKTYMDENGATGSVLYIKQKEDILGDRKKGWILI